jgi:uncharacterized protein
LQLTLTMAELSQQLSALPAHIRDVRQSPPPNIEPRRLAVYRDLFYSNLDGLFSSNFPVLKKILGAQQWQSLINDFLREHQASTPLFPEIAREMLRYLEARRDSHSDPEWWLELAHYEWVELALDISEATHPSDLPDLQSFNLQSPLRLSALAWPLAYQWPVHQLSPDHLPVSAPTHPTLLLVRRDLDYQIHFSELSPLSFRLLQLISEQPTLRADQHIHQLADEAGADDLPAFMHEAEQMIRSFIEQRILY